MNLVRSPLFWLGVGALGAGAYWYYRRGGGAGLLGREANPEPVVVKRNPARMPSPTETRQAGGMTVKRYDMPSMSIDERVKLIQKNVWDGVHDGRIRKLAGHITQHCGRDDGECEARAVYNYVRRNVRYSGDVGVVVNPKTGRKEALDFYQTPARSLEVKVGDCDDASALVASLLAVLGHEVRLRVTAPDPKDEWAHIYAVTRLPKQNPKKTIAVDTTLPSPPFKNPSLGSEARFGKARDYVLEFPA